MPSPGPLEKLFSWLQGGVLFKGLGLTLDRGSGLGPSCAGPSEVSSCDLREGFELLLVCFGVDSQVLGGPTRDPTVQDHTALRIIQALKPFTTMR